MNKLDFNLQIACKKYSGLPSKYEFFYWLQNVIPLSNKNAIITIRLVDEEEMHKLNLTYRGKNKSTNVLSFSFGAVSEMIMTLLGDIVICRQVVEREALEQFKLLKAHWAHMVIHSSLHLLGYDHSINENIIEMETIEIRLLQKLGYQNPFI